MKLIDILVEELPKCGGWPEGAAFVAQEEGGDLWSFTSKPQKDCDDEWMDESRRGYHKKVGKLPEASDHNTSTITREQYEAALDAKNDGWIDWHGGECPVPDDSLVEVKYRNGTVKPAEPARFYIWTNGYGSCSTTDADIIAYRLHKTQQIEQPEESEEDLNECIGQAPEATWSGDGLPPVGCECEYSLNGGKTWWKCKVDYIVGTQGVVMLCDTFEGVQYVPFSSYGNALKFRPIRSEAERKRDAMVNDMVETIFYYYGNPKGAEGYIGLAERIIEAIEIGKITGVKLEG
ncbi:TPA: hypothetical protein LOL70_004806 [Salmonella enterica subsp. enterica serovar Infantis]|nr:hypothetical protein [Salmonella enterica subsp. enterica serovar Infantis]